MFHGAPRSRLSTLELILTPAYKFRFRWRQRVVGLSFAFRLYKDPIFLLGERHKIPRLEFEGLKDLSWDHHLAALPNTTGSLLGCGCLHVRNLDLKSVFSLGCPRRSVKSGS